MIFDLTSEQTSKNFLCEFLNITSEAIDQYIFQCEKDVCLDDFLQCVDRSIENKDINDIKLAALHITTNDDECQTIRDIGLVNLQQALTMDTPLRRYLKKYDIHFDIINNLMFVKDRFYEIEYDSSFFETETKTGKLNSIARKIYFDYQINGFFSIREPKGYGGYVHLRPEIIYDLARLSNKPTEFERKWIEIVKPYLIKFHAPIEYFTYYSFYDTIEEFKDDYITKTLLKRWLVRNSLWAVWEYSCNNKPPYEIMAYLKPEVCIPSKLITEIQAIS
ncbi:MAG: hypothetical protein PHU66_10270 [Bacteroidaceae bacterium]|nr:hypothetical protein [Bacteroidaceae bacterium]